MDKSNLYKVVLVFTLTKGSANEELLRSKDGIFFRTVIIIKQK